MGLIKNIKELKGYKRTKKITFKRQEVNLELMRTMQNAVDITENQTGKTFVINGKREWTIISSEDIFLPSNCEGFFKGKDLIGDLSLIRVDNVESGRALFIRGSLTTDEKLHFVFKEGVELCSAFYEAKICAPTVKISLSPNGCYLALFYAANLTEGLIVDGTIKYGDESDMDTERMFAKMVTPYLNLENLDVQANISSYFMMDANVEHLVIKNKSMIDARIEELQRKIEMVKRLNFEIGRLLEESEKNDYKVLPTGFGAEPTRIVDAYDKFTNMVTRNCTELLEGE